ncbi:MAG: PAS domain S-box protein [Bacteroidales bacterium]|nr:PAS domain S-box protein [Bacteroidales bacterium]
MISKPSNRIITHITTPIILIVFIFIFTILFVIIPVIEENLMSSKKAMIKELTNITWDLLEDYHKREINNELSKEEAQEKVIARIRELRYGSKSKGYFWINNMHPKLIMHPYLSHLENQDVSEFIDPNGKHLFTEFVMAVKKDGEGYVDYVWQQIDDSTRIVAKLSYIKGFEPWGWIIGTGVYIEDVKQQLFGIKKKFNIIFIGIIILFLIVWVYLIIHGRKNEISKNFAQAALSQSENRYHILFNSAADAIFLTKGAVIIDVNKKALEMFACSKEEIIGSTPIDFSPTVQPNGEESKVLAMEKINSALDGNSKLYEWQHKKLNGTLFYTEINLQLINLPAGEHIQAFIRDITDRKKVEKAEVALSQSEKRYHILFNSAVDAIFLMKGDSALIVDVNKKALEMFGCSKEEIIGFTLIGFFPATQPNGEESIVSAMEKISSALKGEPQFFEWQHKKLDGTLFDVEINLHLIKLPKGDHIQTIIRNITDRKKAKKALVNEKNRVANIIEGTNAGTWDWNVQTGEVRLNERWAEIMGYTIKELEPINVQSWMKNIHLDDLPRVNDLLEKNIKGELDYYDVKYRQLHKNDNWVWVNLRGKVVEWTEDGKPIRMSGTLLDINESKLAEGKLKKSESHYRNIFNNSLIGIYQTTPAGKILAANPALIKMLGYSSLNELFERDLENESENFAIGISRLKFKKQIETEGQIIGIESEWKRKDGTILYVRENANIVVDESGKILFYEGTVDDITYTKKAEIEILAANEELLATSDALKESNYELQIALDEAKRSKDLEIANEKLQRNEKVLIQAHESINQKKSELEKLNFALEESHDKTTQLNEELSATNEHLFFQKDKLESTIDKLKETQSQLVQSEKMASVGILTSGIAHEINNPLNFIQGGKLAIENYIEDNLKENMDDFQPLLDIIDTGINRASGIISSLNRFNRKSDTLDEKCEIHIILDNCLIMLQNKLKHRVDIVLHYTNSEFIILGNEGKLHQVFLNILSNAEQSIEKEGTIEITTEIENEILEITISDNGCGISKENLNKIIDPFFTTKDPGKGTGLGLSITYQVIQNHKGNIKINSELEEGTTVIVTLPIINNETEIYNTLR